MSVPALANEQRGKHDAVLDFFIEKHGSDAELVVDTIVDLLKRRGLLSPDEFTSGLTQQGYLSAWHRHVAGALDQPGGECIIGADNRHQLVAGDEAA